MLEAEGGQCSNDGARSSPQIPYTYPSRLLMLLVPHAADEDQTWGDGRFEDTKKNADRDQGGVVLAGTVHRHTYAPKGDHETKILGCRESLHHVCVNGFEHQVADVKYEG